jgi:hypothetical protein
MPETKVALVIGAGDSTGGAVTRTSRRKSEPSWTCYATIGLSQIARGTGDTGTARSGSRSALSTENPE